jgi:hypothetical protein
MRVYQFRHVGTGTTFDFENSAWCPRRDSNPHTLRHMDLNHARLPIPPRGRCFLCRPLRCSATEGTHLKGGIAFGQGRGERFFQFFSLRDHCARMMARPRPQRGCRADHSIRRACVARGQMKNAASSCESLRRSCGILWCPRRDSNPHTLRHMDLNHARLPIPPRGHCRGDLQQKARMLKMETD